ncbi:MAG TPA: FAD-dependent oxidoreductase [Gaiellaceae bacterium]|nr:FAD-dependent oxidoreductase [Gaiellaceae bacterium]
MTAYPNLFSEWQIRNTAIKNRVVFPPTCPTWVSDPWNGIFTEMATAYYEERARGGVGLIIIGAAHVHPSSLMAPLLMPQLWDDRNIEPLREIADAVHRHGCKLAIQLWHSGVRGFPTYKQAAGYDLDATWYTLSPSQVPLGEFPGASTPKELSEEEIEEILEAYAAAARRAIAGGLDGVELHMSHGYLPWQFLSPFYNQRTDRWGGSYENRLRFPVEALTRIRGAIGDGPFLGYRINSTSFWPGDLELEDVKQIVPDLEARADVDYVDVSAGVHHAYIHTPMEFEPGWEKAYAKSIREVSSKPVLLVGRITTPDVAERLLAEGHGDAICLARQLFTDPDWVTKAAEGREDDIRRCVAANYCWKSVSRGGRVQCVYNPEIGREAVWGKGTLDRAAQPRKVLVVGAGPAGLEFARVAAARGHEVVVLEREADVGGHVRLESLLPTRSEYGLIATWLAGQAGKNGAEIRTSSAVTEENLDEVLAAERPDHVVIATGSRVCRDGFQGWTAGPIPGWETGNCVGWDEVATGAVRPTGDVIVLDDLCHVVAPLTAVALADGGASSVRLVTRWPMVGLETILDVYLDWILPKLYQAGVEMVVDHWIESIDGRRVALVNVHDPGRRSEVDADSVVMVTGRRSESSLHPLLQERGVSVELIGDAVAPRGTYEAVYEGHRQARKV